MPVPGGGINTIPVDAVDVNVSGGTVTITPGSNGMCISSEELGGSCNFTDAALAGDVVAVRFCGDGIPTGGTMIGGVMPDGIDDVQVDLAGGGTASVPVTNNAYAQILPGVPRGLSWKDANGDVQSSHELSGGGVVACGA